MSFKKREYKKNIFLFLFVLSTNLLFAQTEIYSKISIEDLIEDIAESTDEELDFSSLYDDLNYYLNNPLNLNIATRDELERLHILNDFQVNSLLDYIQTYGSMLSIYELQLVYGMDVEIIKKILPFVTVSDTRAEDEIKPGHILKYGNNQVFLRGQKILEQQEGYLSFPDSVLAINPNKAYAGNQYKTYIKYKYNYKNRIYWGITAEKDPGEDFFAGSNKNGFDYYSAHLQLNKIGVIKTLTLGDFEAKLGQGLISWSWMAQGKNPYVLNVRKRSQGLKKYSSTEENLFFRGVGTTISIKDFEITAFYSHKNIDANIQDSLNGEISSVSAFQQTGLHALPSEIVDEDAITEKVAGANVTYNRKGFKVGINGIHYTYSADLIKDTTIQNQFDFRGTKNSNLSIDYQFSLGNFSFFGEEAIGENGGKAFLNGVMINPAPRVSMSILQRYYGRNYQANYSNVFSESSGKNESGLYFGIETHLLKNWKAKAYFDTYKFLWIKTGVNAPSEGYDWFFQTGYNFGRELHIYLRLKNENKLVNYKRDLGIDSLLNQQNFKARINISSRVNDQWSLNSRLEISEFGIGDFNKEHGYLVYQDVFYDFRRTPLSLNFRFALFDTDSYNTRIYAYENDILYVFSVPAYYFKGSRIYLNMKYSFNDFIDFWLKYSQTYFSDRNSISSGLNQINGNTKSVIKIQLRLKF